jgi:hypothetical protein
MMTFIDDLALICPAQRTQVVYPCASAAVASRRARRGCICEGCRARTVKLVPVD